MKLQISLEFMLVFAFVILIFIFLFALIATRGSQLFSQQVFAQTQLIAQTIAQQINVAFNSGSGYSANTILQSGYGINTYNITILPNGQIIVLAFQAQQEIQSVAFSQARKIITGNVVNTGAISVQNFFGAICVDVSCPSTANYPGGLALSAQTLHAARFNGVNSYINLGSGFPIGTTVTISAWINSPVVTGSQEPILSNRQGAGYVYFGTTSGNVFTYDNGGTPAGVTSNDLLANNVWYNVVWTSNGATSQFYVNGVPQGTLSQARSSTQGTIYLGYDSATGNYWKGMISNVQVYNTALTAAQAAQLYSEGVGGAPIAPANILAWWPLNGNANDYSGNLNNANDIIQGYMAFPTVSQIQAVVTGSRGNPLNNQLVGLSSNLGSLAANNFAASYTNANGMAEAFVSQNLTNGVANVSLALYPGTPGEARNLTGWWPLTTGFLNKAPVYGSISWWPLNGNANDYKGKNAGTGTNVMYSKIPAQSISAYAGNFNGASSFVSLGDPATLQGQQVPLTITGWFYETSNSPSNQPIYAAYSAGSSSKLWSMVRITSGTLNYYTSTSSGATQDVGTFTPTLNQWHFFAVTVSGNAFSANSVIYLDNSSQSAGLSALSSTPANVPIYIGTDAYSIPSGSPLPEAFNGLISNIQVYNTALSPLQISQLYSEGITGGPVGYTAANALDISGYNNTGTTANVIYSGSGSAFNATSYISTGANSMASGSASRSAFAWVYFTGNNVAQYAVQDYGTATPAESAMLGISQGEVMAGGYSDYFTSNLTVPKNGWSFIGYTYSSGATNITTYLNGKYQTGSLNGGVALNTVIPASDPSDIGRCSNNLNACYFSGGIADLQLYATALTPTQEWQIYAAGPPAPYNVSVPFSLYHP